jgi:FixJ family two-component response regulator
MPGKDGLALHGELARAGIFVPVIFLTGYCDIPMSVRAMKAGAVDFLTKPVNDADLLAAVRTALDKSAEQLETAAAVLLYSRLTRREREVLEGVIAGKPSKQIAADFGTSEQNIKMHRSQMMRKMEVRSVADLVRVTGRARDGLEARAAMAGLKAYPPGG